MPLPPLPEDQWDERTEAALASLLPPGRRNPRGAGAALATFRRVTAGGHPPNTAVPD
ncbi:MAG: Carboxymuconolactone decarboxylase family protein [Actinomycetia bacterium]|nr:Carboxymuconolactone decarboxylase family protein [Actinomycetes bacterium]